MLKKQKFSENFIFIDKEPISHFSDFFVYYEKMQFLVKNGKKIVTINCLI